MEHLSGGMLLAAFGTFVGADEDNMSRKCVSVMFAATVIQGIVLFVILCPVSILYVFGIYISAGASLWRLIKHDFGNDGDGGANMKPALQVLYSLAVAQGLLFGYKTIHAFAAKNGLVKLVYNWLDKEVLEVLIEEYLEETVAGCEKDPSFAAGRNLVTYGVDLMMEAKSNKGFVAGIEVLGGAINDGEKGRKKLAKYVLTRSSDSASTVIQRLLEALADPRRLYSRENMERAAKILDIIAGCIPLEQLPRAIQCLCSIVDTYEEDYLENGYTVINATKENRRDFDQLLVIAANIIYKLVAHNCKCNGWNMPTFVSTTMIHKTAMFPTKLHRANHDPCKDQKSELKMLEQCWVIIEWLLIALTETSSPPILPSTSLGVEEGEERLLVLGSTVGSAFGSTIKRTIEDSIQSTIKCIFDCLDCRHWQKKQAIQILLHLSWDMSFIMDSDSSKRRLSWILLLIFCSTDDSKYWMVPSLIYRNKNCCDFDGIRKLAGEKLSEIMLGQKHQLPSKQSARELLQSIRRARQDLESALNGDSEDISMRRHASIIMEGLSRGYDRRGDYDTRVSELQRSLVDAVPEVVTETSIPCGPIRAESQEPPATDLEMGIVSKDIQDGSLDIE